MRYTRSVLATVVAATTVVAAGPARAAQAAQPAEIVRDGITLLHERTPVTAKPVTGKGATRSDFDGDGRDDLAAFSDRGLSVTYSSAPHRDLLVTEIPGSGCVCFGASMVPGNFNGDRYDDLAVADYSEADLRTMGYSAGAVWVFPGGPGGLQVTKVTHFNQSTTNVPGTSARDDWFGFSLAAGDITGDGRDELAIGIPNKAIGNKKQAGAVVVLKGSATGVVAAGTRWLSQATAGVPDTPESGDHFGSSVAIGRVDKNRYQELIVGAPQEDDGKSFEGTGLITQFWGAAGGVSLAKPTTVSGRQATLAAKQTGTYLWYLGSELAVGDTTGDGYGEVIDGDSGAEVDWEINPGALVSFPGRGTGLSAKGVIVLSQDSKGVSDYTENDDRFAESIAVGDVTGDGRADVLAGVAGEDFGKFRDAGSIVLLRGSAKGLTGVGSQTLTQSSSGVPDNPERDDTFGSAVALLNLNGSGGLDAAVGTPQEQLPGDTAGYQSGTVTRLFGSKNGLGYGSLVSGRALGVVEGRYGWEIAR